LIVYDFGCALADYCLQREPEFFRDTLFVVDRFHEQGHKTCSPASRASSYDRHPLLHDLNTQLAESGNSELSKFRTSVSYMKESNAILNVGAFLMARNRVLYLQARPELAKKVTVEEKSSTKYLKRFKVTRNRL
jgi:hypothetical protein